MIAIKISHQDIKTQDCPYKYIEQRLIDSGMDLGQLIFISENFYKM